MSTVTLSGSDFEESKITVAVRCRPFSDREHNIKSKLCIDISGGSVTIYDGSTDASEADKKRSCHTFSFDYAYNMKVTQEKVYHDIGRPVLAASLKGFNTCIFAYGQTGSGKSYSMMGPIGHRAREEFRGIIPRLCIELFEQATNGQLVRETQSNCSEVPGKYDNAHCSTFTIQLSYLEIYQENVTCLLNEKKKKLRVRQHPSMGVYVENLTELTVTNYEIVEQLIEYGAASRHVASTDMNDESSRSHAILSLMLTQRNTKVTKDGAEIVAEVKSKINLVDLAGSERAKSTGSDVGTLKEGAHINKSLTTLGLVISGLADMCKKDTGGRSSFVPYRDSMLTWLLKESLGGNSKTFMLSTVSPAGVNYDETLSTLRYADRAKSIVTHACINESPCDKKIRELEEEIFRLKEIIKKSAAQPMEQSLNHCVFTDENNVEPEKLTQAELLDRVEQAQALILHENRTTEQEQQELAEVANNKRNRTIKAPTQDPYLLNLDNVGGWVVEKLVDEVTYLGCEDLDEPVVGARCIVISGDKEELAGIGPQHCCFLRDPLTDSIMLRPLPGWDTYLEDEDDPLDRDTLIINGQVIQIGEKYVGFKLIEPAVTAPVTGRRRTIRRNTDFENMEVLGTATQTTPQMSVPSLKIPVTTNRARISVDYGSDNVIVPYESDVCHVDEKESVPERSPSLTVEAEEVINIQRHSYIFLGNQGAGKTTIRVNLSKEDKWFPFFKKQLPVVQPTYAYDTSVLQTQSAAGKVNLTLFELSGNHCFTTLQLLLPNRRVSYVLCFKLVDDHSSLGNFRSYLEFMLCQSCCADTDLILLGTYVDKCHLDDRKIVLILLNLENEINNFFQMRQPLLDRRPRIVGKFAVSNRDRVVISSGSNVSKFPDLLAWMADHAIKQCKGDKEFPKALFPQKLITFAKRIVEHRKKGIWCLSLSEYKKMATGENSRYNNNSELLHTHTQMLQSWGILYHHYRHLHLRHTVILDVPWVMSLISAICCAIPVASHSAAIAEGFNSGVSIAQFGLLSPEIIEYRDKPFHLSSIQSIDPSGLSTAGILTMATLKCLLSSLVVEKNYAPEDITSVLELLESYDIIMRGSRMKPSFFQDHKIQNLSMSSSLTISYHDDDQLHESDPEEDEVDPVESFYLMPNCFTARPHKAITLHLNPLLFGPSYKFQLSMVPTNFFSRFVVRVSRYANQLYMGPVKIVNPSNNRSFMSAGYVYDTEIKTADFWCSAVWIISSSESRALVRIVNNSMYITFHDHAGDEVFHEGLRQVVYSLVSESPGVQCQELVLCQTSGTGYDGSDEEIWIERTDNLNSLEKNLEMERQSFRSPKDIPIGHQHNGNINDKCLIPLVRSRNAKFDVATSLAPFMEDSTLTPETIYRVKQSLKLIAKGRALEDRERGAKLEGKAMDHIIDAIAQSV